MKLPEQPIEVSLAYKVFQSTHDGISLLASVPTLLEIPNQGISIYNEDPHLYPGPLELRINETPVRVTFVVPVLGSSL